MSKEGDRTGNTDTQPPSAEATVSDPLEQTDAFARPF